MFSTVGNFSFVFRWGILVQWNITTRIDLRISHLWDIVVPHTSTQGLHKLFFRIMMK